MDPSQRIVLLPSVLLKLVPLYTIELPESVPSSKPAPSPENFRDPPAALLTLPKVNVPAPCAIIVFAPGLIVITPNVCVVVPATAAFNINELLLANETVAPEVTRFVGEDRLE